MRRFLLVAALVAVFVLGLTTAAGGSPSKLARGCTTATVRITTTVFRTVTQTVTQTVTTTLTQPTTTVPTTTTTPTTTGTTPAGNVPIPTSGAYWGEFADSSIATRQQQVGRTFGVVHDYHDWFQTWGGANQAEKTFADNGQIVFDSVISRNYNTGAIIPWGQVANGSQDQRIDVLAGYARSLGHPMFISYHVEPETDIGTYGTSADYVAAFRHLVQRFKADGATNVSWVWQTEGYSSHYSQYPALYPGDDVVDWIAWDPYNLGSCTSSPWQTFAQTVQPFYTWLQQNGHANKPLMLGEYGTVEAGDGGQMKHQWFLDELAAMKAGQFPNLKAVVYFDKNWECPTAVDSTSLALSGYAQSGADSFFKP